MGATVTGIDATAASVGVATAHAVRDPLVQQRTAYRCITTEELVQEGEPP